VPASLTKAWPACAAQVIVWTTRPRTTAWPWCRVAGPLFAQSHCRRILALVRQTTWHCGRAMRPLPCCSTATRSCPPGRSTRYWHGWTQRVQRWPVPGL
jgi:hypothetical protein